ncbi:MAG TPA: hypothetical protein VF905_10895 [Nitrospirota bacterium]
MKSRNNKTSMRVTLGELLGRISAKEGEKIELDNRMKRYDEEWKEREKQRKKDDEANK